MCLRFRFLLKVQYATGHGKNKFFLVFASCSTPRSGFSGQCWQWKAILIGLDIHPVLELKNSWRFKGYRYPLNPLQTSPTPPLPHKHSACGRMLHCTLYSTLYSAIVQRKNCEPPCTTSTVLYLTYCSVGLGALRLHSIAKTGVTLALRSSLSVPVLGVFS